MPKPKRTIYTRRCAFRASPILSEKLTALADRLNRNESDLVRHAVAEFLSRYEACPETLERLT